MKNIISYELIRISTTDKNEWNSSCYRAGMYIKNRRVGVIKFSDKYEHTM